YFGWGKTRKAYLGGGNCVPWPGERARSLAPRTRPPHNARNDRWPSRVARPARARPDPSAPSRWRMKPRPLPVDDHAGATLAANAVLAEAQRRRDLPLGHLGVLTVLVHAGALERGCTLSHAQIAKSAALSHATVKRAMRSLVQKGWLLAVAQYVGARRTGSVWRVRVPGAAPAE